MEIYSVFVIVAGDGEWDIGEDEIPTITNAGDDGGATQDFLLGTFSSEEAAEADVAKFLPEYRVGAEETSDRFQGWNQPIRGITLWKTELDAGQAVGEFVKWMRGTESAPLSYPYK